MQQIKTQSRVIGAAVSAVIGVALATPVIACLPEPWPQWSDIQRPDGPDLMIVRVTRIDVAETPRISDRSELFDETVTVEVVQALQGAPDAQYQMTQLHSRRPLSDEPMRCLPWRVELTVGDVVIAYENRDGRLRIPQPYHVPSDLKVVLEAYQ